MWKKGESGNPNGAPSRRRLVTSHIERELLVADKEGDANKARKIAEKVVQMAVDGNPWAIQFVTERTEGKPDQHVSVSRSVRELADDELHDIAAGGSARTAEAESGPQDPKRVH